MKKFIVFLLTTITLNSFAQSANYESAMGSTLQQFGNATTAEALTAVAAKFERIGDAEKTQWLPYYYAGLIKARLGFQVAGQGDKLADEAEALTDKAIAINKNSEILCLQSMIATVRLVVDPMNRWMTYGKQSNDFLEEAKKLDPTNPRPYVLQSSSLKNTPEAFGGGCTTAKPVAEAAIKLFEAFKPVSALYPNWGKDQAEALVAGCQ